MKNAWVGIDIGKDFHWVVAIGDTGGGLLSRRVENSETDLLSLIAEPGGFVPGHFMGGGHARCTGRSEDCAPSCGRQVCGLYPRGGRKQKP